MYYCICVSIYSMLSFENFCIQNNLIDILNEWNYDKNYNYGLTPKNISHGSSKKVWWKCNKGHEW